MFYKILISTNDDEVGLIKISRVIALISFILGTLVLITFYLSENAIFAIIGLFYVIIATIINSVFLIALLLKLTKRKSNKKQIVISILLAIFNIPIALIYYKIAMFIIGSFED